MNDFRYGSEGLKQDSLSFLFPVTRRLIAGAEGTIYKTNAYNKVHSAKLPLTYTGTENLATFTPFIYSHHLGMTAFGGFFSIETVFSFQNETKDTLSLSLLGGYASIKGESTAGEIEKFSQTSLGLKAEMNVQQNFKFIAGGTGFFNPSNNMEEKGLAKSVFDMKDILDVQAYQVIRDLPEWAASVKFVRTFQPDYDNAFYLGYSKISFRDIKGANSYLAGMEFFVSENTTWELAYNFFKYQDTSAKQYFRIFVSTVF